MRAAILALALALTLPAAGSAQDATLRSAEPFKLGTFAFDGRPTVGIVLRDSIVVELMAANRELELRPQYVRMPMPNDMLGVIERYEYGVQRRIYEIVNALVGDNRLQGDRRPSYVHDVVTATMALLGSAAPIGLYHCVNSGTGTWLDIANELKALTGLHTAVTPVSVADVKLRAPRPRYCALSNAKLAAAGAPMPAWQDALRRHLRAMGQLG